MEREEKLQLLTPFFNELETIQPLTKEVREFLTDKFSVEHIDKETILLSEGEVCKYFFSRNVSLCSLWVGKHFIYRLYFQVVARQSSS